uniref:Uncharacterized protein n=1 Tax=Lepeophtheirus salmonis TaxID=72036 RepID=A0A0K2UJT7_LEPSM
MIINVVIYTYLIVHKLYSLDIYYIYSVLRPIRGSKSHQFEYN